RKTSLGITHLLFRPFHVWQGGASLGIFQDPRIRVMVMTASPVCGSVVVVLFLPYRHSCFELVNDEATALKRLAAVSGQRLNHHGRLSDAQAAGAMHGAHKPQLKEFGCLLADATHLFGRKSFVGLVVQADDA